MDRQTDGRVGGRTDDKWQTDRRTTSEHNTLKCDLDRPSFNRNDLWILHTVFVWRTYEHSFKQYFNLWRRYGEDTKSWRTDRQMDGRTDGHRDDIMSNLVLFVRLFDSCLFGFIGFLFLLVSGKGCGLWLWHSLDFFSYLFFLNNSNTDGSSTMANSNSFLNR